VIAVDTSALMAIVLNEPTADDCISLLAKEDEILISAGTVAEALIVAAIRNVGAEMTSIIRGVGFEVVPVTSAAAERIAEAYARWGRGTARSAGLNFGDCFAYEVAKDRGCPLLFVGDDFKKTDIASAL
jgi:ribonuclease VapC